MGSTYTHTVILSNPTAQNPFTVASDGAIFSSLGDGILGTAGFAWTLFNDGTISTTDTFRAGVDLTTGGLLVGSIGESLMTGQDFATHYGAFAVTASQSDLIPENITLGSTGVSPGGPLFVSWDIMNQGSATTDSPSTTVLRITSSSTSVAGSDLAFFSTSALAAGASEAFSATLKAPGTAGSDPIINGATTGVVLTPPSGGGGTYYVWVIADRFGQVTNQSDITNDAQASASFQVLVGVSPLPVTVTASAYVTNTTTNNNGDAIFGTSSFWDIENFGTVVANGSASTGVKLTAGGAVNNAVGALIAGSAVGVIIGGGGGVVTNAGTVTGSTGISGVAGFNLTVTNAGTIIGTAGTAVALAGGSNRLIVAPGAAFTGVVDGGGGASVLEIAATGTGFPGLAAGLAAATDVSLGSVVNFTVLDVDPTATFGGLGVLSFDTMVNEGWVNIGSGVTLALGVVPSAANAGVIDLQAGGTIEFGALVGNQTLFFQPPGGTAEIDDAAQFFGTISGFTGTLDVIDLTGFSPTGATATINASEQLVVNNGSQTVSLQLDTAADYTGITWATSADGTGGTDIAPVVCFCRGTRILTEHGEVPVEALAVGDRVVTLAGAAKPIRWIGLGRDLVTNKNPLARPIVVAAGALADGVPRRDLYLTHGHALYLNGVLVPVEHLVNHRTIRWDEEARVVEYYHIELDDHDVLIAEGAPAESYYDAGNRALFHNTRPRSAPAAPGATCAPVLSGGEVVARLWQRLAARAGACPAAETSDDPDLHLVVAGARLDPARIADGVYTFRLAGPPDGSLHLRSRSVVPSLAGQSRHEHRRLGVAIRQIVLRAPGVTTCLDHDAALFVEGGCHPPERGLSWTDGEFSLPARLFQHLQAGSTVLVHTSRQSLRYPIAAPLAEAA